MSAHLIKIDFLSSQPKHMLWVLKQAFEHLNTFKLVAMKIITFYVSKHWLNWTYYCRCHHKTYKLVQLVDQGDNLFCLHQNSEDKKYISSLKPVLF